MREEEILTLQSAVELDRIHNEGRLLRALKGEQISKEEMISSIFSIVQKKNAQNETQKLLSHMAQSNSGNIGDYWDKEETTIKDKILNGLLFDRNGNFKIDYLRNIGIGVLGLFVVSYVYVKSKINNRAVKKSKNNRKEVEAILQKDEDFERVKEQYKKKLELLNQLLDNENISDEDRDRYKKEKEKTEQKLNNNDNYVGGIVGAQ